MELDFLLFSTLAVGSSCAVATGFFWLLVNRLNEFSQSRIHSRRLREQWRRAKSYGRQIENLLKNSSRQADEDRLHRLMDQVDRWLEAIETLTRRIDRFQTDPLVKREISDIPHSIKRLEFQLRQEENPDIRAKLEKTIANRRRHLEAFENLQVTMRKAELEIEHTISSLGIIYSQVLSGQSTRQVADYTRLSQQVDEQVEVLQDYLGALEEVQLEKQTTLEDAIAEALADVDELEADSELPARQARLGEDESSSPARRLDAGADEADTDDLTAAR